MDNVEKKAAAFWAGDCSGACRVFPEGPYLRGYNKGFSDGLRMEKKCAAKGGLAGSAGILVDGFILECCTLPPDGKEEAAGLYKRFLEWYLAHGGKEALTCTWFGRSLSKRFKKTKSNGRILYRDIALISTEKQPLTDACVGITEQEKPGGGHLP
jgi:hypothetical protein